MQQSGTHLCRLYTEKIALWDLVFAEDDWAEYDCEVFGIHLVLIRVGGYAGEMFHKCFQ